MSVRFVHEKRKIKMEKENIHERDREKIKIDRLTMQNE